MPKIIRKIKLPGDTEPRVVYDERIDKQISSSDEGKVLKVNSDGSISAADGSSGSVTQVNGFDPDTQGHVEFPYVYSDDSTPSDPTPVNADLLNNQPASYYADKTYVNNKNFVPDGGSTNQVLTKTSTGYGWANPQGSGTGDMLASTYDPQGKAQDIFQYADDAAASIDVPTTLAELTDDTTHRTVTDTEKATWNGKQNAISDLDEIRSGAALGATALQGVPNTYRTAAAQDVIDSGKVDKATGKGLSSNDFTTAEKTKLAALENYDDTSLSGRVSVIEGKESGWDAKYSAQNPPPYPVTSVNGQVGAVSVPVPTALSQLADDTTHRTVTDAEKSAWNGKQPQHNTQTVTLTVAGWENNQQTVSVSGVTANNTVMVSPAPASVFDYGDAGICCSAQASGTLTFSCASVPTSAVTVNTAIFD